MKSTAPLALLPWPSRFEKIEFLKSLPGGRFLLRPNSGPYRKSLDVRLKKSSPKIEPAYFDLAGAAAYTGRALSVRTLRRLIGLPGGLPYIQVGRGKIMVKRADLDAFLEAHRHKPMDLDAIANEALKELRAK